MLNTLFGFRWFCRCRGLVILLLAMFLSFNGFADTAYLRTVTQTLAAPQFAGRGYVKDGMKHAAEYIATEMQSAGLSVVEQKFHYPVNRFPNRVQLMIDGKALRPGIDFLVQADSRSVSVSGNLTKIDSAHFAHRASGVVIMLTSQKLTWTVATTQSDQTVFLVSTTAVAEPSTFEIQVDAELVRKFEAVNVLGTMLAAVPTDSFLVLTAHYDHLGMMGNDAVFAGANDNASGVALMLSMAKRYLANPLKYNLLCIAFAGEEAGLIGSAYYVRHPSVLLSKIRFLLNLDLMGNGETGITVVNATEHSAAFAELQNINRTKGLLAAVNGRGKAQNSDHYWFGEAGVPSFFMYTLGPRTAYHDVYDIASTLPWDEGQDLETLIALFWQRLAEGCCR